MAGRRLMAKQGRAGVAPLKRTTRAAVLAFAASTRVMSAPTTTGPSLRAKRGAEVLLPAGRRRRAPRAGRKSPCAACIAMAEAHMPSSRPQLTRCAV